ncbi:WD repeat-containing protein 96, partial [Paragonimus kellicotti]
DNIYRIKETFNKNFDDVYAKKESGLSKIRTRLARIRKILIDIQQSSATKSIIDPAFSPEEQPEMLLTVDDSEITVDLYLSPAELAEREARRLAEEERRRREKLDNWRERGLEEMMGGVLEVRKEDELKKDVPKPAFLLMGKPVAHWTPDDRRLYAEYERKVQELNEEREKYRKRREDELKLIRMRREALTVDLSNLLRDYHYDQTNLELQLLTKQGQVEIEVPEGQLVHDYGDALLISRERVEELNAHIITLGGSKVAHMIKNKEFKKRFYHLE